MRYLHLGFELELYAFHEYAAVFNYLTYLYGFLQNNRKMALSSFCADLFKKGLLSFDDGENYQFKKKRKKFTPT